MNTDKKDAERGVYEKFRVERTDGRSEPGEKHHGCAYFVLDLDHDPHAVAALEAYAESCRLDYPALSRDVHHIAHRATFGKGGKALRESIELNTKVEAAIAQATELIAALTRVKNRVSRGVCPNCNRTFKDLARHMASKHPVGTEEKNDG